MTCPGRAAWRAAWSCAAPLTRRTSPLAAGAGAGATPAEPGAGPTPAEPGAGGGATPGRAGGRSRADTRRARGRGDGGRAGRGSRSCRARSRRARGHGRTVIRVRRGPRVVVRIGVRGRGGGRCGGGPSGGTGGDRRLRAWGRRRAEADAVRGPVAGRRHDAHLDLVRTRGRREAEVEGSPGVAA